MVVGPINLPVGRLFVEEVITECRKRGASRVDVLAFEFEMGLFPAALDEAKQKGIDLAPVLLELLIWGASHEKTGAPCSVIENLAKNRQQVLKEVRRRWRERDSTPLLPFGPT